MVNAILTAASIVAVQNLVPPCFSVPVSGVGIYASAGKGVVTLAWQRRDLRFRTWSELKQYSLDGTQHSAFKLPYGWRAIGTDRQGRIIGIDPRGAPYSIAAGGKRSKLTTGLSAVDAMSHGYFVKFAESAELKLVLAGKSDRILSGVTQYDFFSISPSGNSAATLVRLRSPMEIAVVSLNQQKRIVRPRASSGAALTTPLGTEPVQFIGENEMLTFLDAAPFSSTEVNVPLVDLVRKPESRLNGEIMRYVLARINLESGLARPILRFERDVVDEPSGVSSSRIAVTKDQKHAYLLLWDRVCRVKL